MIYLEIRRKDEPSLVPLVERWVDYGDGKNLLAHMDDHTLYSNDPKNEKTHKKVNGVDYHYTFSASIPVRMRDSNDRKNKKGDLLVNTSDIAVYVARAEELADDKASSLAGSFISTKNGYFVKYKVLISSPPSYEVVVYERDENTSEPIIHSYWWTDRDGLQSGPLKWQGFPLPKSEVSARESSMKIKDSGKVYYKEYEVCEPEESKDRKIEEKTKEFDYWSKAKKFYLENKWVYKAERLHYGDVGETLEREGETIIKDPMDDVEYWVDLIVQKSNNTVSDEDLVGLKVDELKSIYETYKALASIAKGKLKDSDIWELMKNNRARKLLVGMSDDGRDGFLEEYIGLLQDINDKNATIDDVVDLIEDDIRTRRLPESLDLLEAGYDGYSMSNNARAAYANDEKPLSKWSKDDILYCASRINKYKAMPLKKVSLEDLRNHLLTRTSWHHTSSYYNQTDFYSFDEEAYENVHESDINRWVEEHKQDMADKKKETPRVRKGRIDYLVWYGSRAHPRASEEHLDNINIEVRGSFYVITDDSGKEILRKKIGSNGTHVRFYEGLGAIDEERKQTAVKSNGVYSVLKGEWVKEPVAGDIPDVDEDGFEKLFHEWEDRYFELTETPGAAKDDIEKFIEDVYDLRKSSIADGGEYDVGNLVFKEMRSLGYLDNLREIKRGIVDKELSLESLQKASSAKGKSKYAYDGPIRRFGRYVKSAHIETFASSFGQAVNNIKFKACSMIGYDRASGAQVEINSDDVFEIDDGPTEASVAAPSVTKICPKCGIVHLNDAGECPLCDLGDESVLDDNDDENSL